MPDSSVLPNSRLTCGVFCVYAALDRTGAATRRPTRIARPDVRRAMPGYPAEIGAINPRTSPVLGLCACAQSVRLSRPETRRPTTEDPSRGKLDLRISFEGAAIVAHPCCVGRLARPHRTVAQHIAAADALPGPIAPSAAVIAHHRGEKRLRA